MKNQNRKERREQEKQKRRSIKQRLQGDEQVRERKIELYKRQFGPVIKAIDESLEDDSFIYGEDELINCLLFKAYSLWRDRQGKDLEEFISHFTRILNCYEGL